MVLVFFSYHVGWRLCAPHLPSLSFLPNSSLPCGTRSPEQCLSWLSPYDSGGYYDTVVCKNSLHYTCILVCYYTELIIYILESLGLEGWGNSYHRFSNLWLGHACAPQKVGHGFCDIHSAALLLPRSLLLLPKQFMFDIKKILITLQKKQNILLSLLHIITSAQRASTHYRECV